MNHASYLHEAFNRKAQDQTIREIKSLIKKKDLKFDGFVVIGVSGIVIGSIIARLLNKDLVVVRKNNDFSHSTWDVENYKTGRDYIFVDDLISSGSTFDTVKSKLKEVHHNWKQWYPNIETKESKIVGRILYSDKVKYKKL